MQIVLEQCQLEWKMSNFIYPRRQYSSTYGILTNPHFHAAGCVEYASTKCSSSSPWPYNKVEKTRATYVHLSTLVSKPDYKCNKSAERN